MRRLGCGLHLDPLNSLRPFEQKVIRTRLGRYRWPQSSKEKPGLHDRQGCVPEISCVWCQTGRFWGAFLIKMRSREMIEVQAQLSSADLYLFPGSSRLRSQSERREQLPPRRRVDQRGPQLFIRPARPGPEVAGIEAEPLRFTLHDVIRTRRIKTEVPQDPAPRLSITDSGSQIFIGPASSFR